MYVLQTSGIIVYSVDFKRKDERKVIINNIKFEKVSFFFLVFKGKIKT